MFRVLSPWEYPLSVIDTPPSRVAVLVTLRDIALSSVLGMSALNSILPLRS